jgi:hypothetical protein
MSSEDDFMDIVKNNELEKYMSESESYNLTVKDIHIGIRDLAECILFLTDFLNSFFNAINEGKEDERPALTIDTINYAHELFNYASKFTDSIVESMMDDDDDDDDYYDEDEDEDEDEE